MKAIIQWFLLPYPMVETHQERCALSLLLGIAVFLTLLVLQPFGLREIHSIKFLFMMGFGGVTTGITLCGLYIQFLFYHFHLFKGEWNVAKQMVFLIMLVEAITCGNWLLNESIRTVIVSPHYSFSEFFLMTLFIGTVPLGFVIFYSERVLRKKNTAIAKELSDSLHTSIEQSKVKPLAVDSFLYAKSEGNYVQLFSIHGESKVLRMTMKELVDTYLPETHIVRVHRSYLVNLSKVDSVKGNAGGLLLALEKETLIPVSRSMVQSVKALLQKRL